MINVNILRGVLVALALTAAPVHADTGEAMRTALDLAAGKDWDGALAVAPAGVGRDIIEWQALRAGEGQFADYQAFLSRHPDWPGLPYLREKGEATLALIEDPAQVMGWFQADLPQTGAGSLALVQALLAQGRVAEAETETMRGWASLPFAEADETALIALMPDAVALADEQRLETALWDGRIVEARRMLPRVSKDLQALAAALYVDAGVRAMERGAVSAGRDHNGVNHMPKLELVRLTIPRRVYTQAHMDVVAESVIEVAEQAHTIKGLRFTYEPAQLRFFLGRFEPVD